MTTPTLTPNERLARANKRLSSATEKINKAEQRLQQKFARERDTLARARERKKKAQNHRKIVIGGTVIAARGDTIPAERLAGLIDFYLDRLANLPDADAARWNEQLDQRGAIVFKRRAQA